MFPFNKLVKYQPGYFSNLVKPLLSGDNIFTASQITKCRAQPNPSQNEFTLITRSNSDQALTIRLMDAQGRVVETVKGASANDAVQIGRKFLPGIYFAEVLQGKQKKMLKLIKQ